MFLCLVSKLSFLARSHVRFFTMVSRRHVSPANSMTKLRKPTSKSVYRRKKKLFACLGAVCIMKNCDLGLENAALGLRPRAAFSRPRSQFFTIRTPQPANNIYMCCLIFFKTLQKSYISTENNYMKMLQLKRLKINELFFFV